MKAFLLLTSLLLSTGLAKAHDPANLERKGYWYGYSTGATTTLCALNMADMLSTNDGNKIMKAFVDSLAATSPDANVNMNEVEKGIAFALRQKPNCKIRVD